MHVKFDVAGLSCWHISARRMVDVELGLMHYVTSALHQPLFGYYSKTGQQGVPSWYDYLLNDPQNCIQHTDG